MCVVCGQSAPQTDRKALYNKWDRASAVAKVGQRDPKAGRAEQRRRGLALMREEC